MYKNIIVFLKSKIRNIGFQKKILLGYVILIVLPVLVISYFIFYNFYVEKRNETVKFLKQSSLQAIVRVDNYFMQMDSITKDPLYDNEVLKGLKNSNSNDSLKSDFDIDNFFSPFLNKILLYDENIYAVFIIDNNEKYAYRFINTTLSDEYTLENEIWYKNCLDKEGDLSIESTDKYFKDDLIFNKNQTNTFVTSRVIKDVNNSTEKLGLLAVFTDVKFLSNIVRDLEYYENERILILDEENNICYDNVESNIGNKMESLPFNYNESNSFVEINSINYMSIIIESEYVKWKMIRLIPKNELFDSIYETQNRYILLAIIFVILTLVLAFYVTSVINKPVSKIVDTMKAIEEGNLNKRCTVIYDDEIGKIGNTFNSMMDKIDDLFKKIRNVEIRKKEAENNFLQAQINPHFIYNTLESIRMMSEINDDKQTAKMIVMLGKLLRYGVNVKEQIVTVKKEIEYIKDYINLQNIRFGNKYVLKVRVFSKLYDLKIPKLIFQPIIENSIYHAFEDKNYECILTIEGYIFGEDAIFEISDNGIGISESRIDILNYNIKNNTYISKNGNGIGLANVNERINIIYSLDYGIEILKIDKGGTKVKICLPLIN